MRNRDQIGGIYIIFNNLKWRIYVGSCASFKERQKVHFSDLRRQKHANRFLQADYNLCGEAAFEFHILETLLDSSKEERLAREQYWLNIHYDGGNRCYNLRKEAASKEGTKHKFVSKAKGKPLSASHRKAIGDGMRGIIRPACRGRKLSEAHRNSISLGHLGRQIPEEVRLKISKSNTGKTRSDETRKRSADSAKKRMERDKLSLSFNRAVCQYDLDGALIAEFPSIAEANRVAALYVGQVQRSLKTNSPTTNGFMWRYKT